MRIGRFSERKGKLKTDAWGRIVGERQDLRQDRRGGLEKRFDELQRMFAESGMFIVQCSQQFREMEGCEAVKGPEGVKTRSGKFIGGEEIAKR